MYKNSTYYGLVSSGRAFTFSGSLVGSSTLALTDDDIMEGGLQIDEALTADSSITVGGIVTSQLKLTLNNFEGRFSSFTFDESVTITGSLTIDTESVTLPTYHIIDYNVGPNVIEVIALDYTDLLNAQLPATLTGSTYKAAVTNIATAGGMTATFSTTANTRLNVAASDLAQIDPAKETYKSALLYILQKCNVYARIQSGTELYLYYIEPTATPVPIDEGMIVKLDIDGPHAPTLAAVRAYTSDALIASGTPGYNITLEGNPLITTADPATLLSQLSGISFYNFSLESIGDPSVQIGDYITIGGAQQALVASKSYKQGGYMTTALQWSFDNKAEFTYAQNGEQGQAITNEITGAIDDLEIGGRNLVEDSNFKNKVIDATNVWTNNGDGTITASATATGQYTTNTNARTDLYQTDYAEEVIQEGTDITISFEYKIEEALTYGTNNAWVGLFIQYLDAAGTNSFSVLGPTGMPTAVTDGWVRAEATFTLRQTPTTFGRLWMYFRDTAGTVSFRHPKIEIGQKATDWELAPEDVEGEIAEAAKTATNYLSIDSSGIMVADLANGQQTPSTATGRNVFIDSDSVDIRDGQTVLASFGSDVVVGDSAGTHLKISNRSIDMKQGSGTKIAHFGYTYGSGQVTTDPYYDLGARNASANIGDYSLIEGYNNAASAYCAHAEGYGTRASGLQAHSEGTGTTASGKRAHAEGYNTTASGDYSHAEGYGTTASGDNYAHAEGYNTTASGRASHAEGYNTTAGGGAAHAEGQGTSASEAEAHAEGLGTSASGLASHAEGSGTSASGRYSHAGGRKTIAGKESQTVIGTYNIEDTAATTTHPDGDATHGEYALIIGNGFVIEDDEYRRNAFAIDWKGNIKHQTGKPLPTLSYGTCSTYATTAAKLITLDADMNFTLTPGSIIGVKFDNTNTAQDPTFTIMRGNTTLAAALPVWYNTAQITTGSLGAAGTANRPSYYMYDGTNWVFLSWSADSNTTYTPAALGFGYGTNTQSASTTARTATIAGYTLGVGGIVSIHFSNAVPAGATLNIRTRGAKPIFYHGAAITAGVIGAGQTATFIYDGTNYNLIGLI